LASYKYKARDKNGNLIEATLEASSPKDIARMLISQEMTPISITEFTPDIDLFEQFNKWQDLRSLKLDDLILFSRQMYSLTKAGVPIIRAIHSLVESTRNKALSSALSDIAVSLESGVTMGNAMEQHPKIFSSLFLNVIKVGESTGSLDQGFLQISDYLTREKETQNRIKSALQYPTMVLIAISIAMMIVNIYVIPAFKGVFDKMGAELPWQTKALINISDFTVEFWPYIAGVLVISFYGLKQYFQTADGLMTKDRLILKIPGVGSIIQRASMERFSRSFAMILSAGVPIIQGITVVSGAIGNQYIGSKLNKMRIGIEKGDSISRMAMSVGLFTPLVVQMIMVGEETGDISTMLLEAADFYETEVDAELKNLASVIEPFLLVIVGIMVLILALGIFLPMWNLSAAMH